MDALTLSASGVLATLISTIIVAIYHKFLAPAAPATPATPASPLTGHPVLDLIGSGISDLLKQLGTGAIKSGAQSMVIPFLIKVLQDVAAAAPPTPAPSIPPGTPAAK